MSYEAKFQFTRAVFGLGFILSIVCLFLAYRSGMAFNAHGVEVWSRALIVVVGMTLPFGVMFYYYRGRRFDDKTQTHVGVEALSHYAENENGQSQSSKTPKPHA